MKRKLYYIAPVVIMPIFMLVCELLDDMELIKMNPYLLSVELSLISAVMGFLSPSNKRFDWYMTVIMPLSLFCFMFILGLITKDDFEEMFNFDFCLAARIAFQPWALIEYLLMATFAFLFSFRGIRKIRNRCKK